MKKNVFVLFIFLVACAAPSTVPTATPLQPTTTNISTPSLTPTFTPLPSSTVTPTVPPLPNEMADEKGVDMRLAPAGEFTMGSNNGNDDEQPVHQVYLDAFYMDAYEVTNALYRACVDLGNCTPPHDTSSLTHSSYYDNSEFDTYPVIQVDWNQAKAYCEWRGGNLPTEAQWEKAARGTDERIYPWGDQFAGNRVNFCDRNCAFDWADRTRNNDDGYADIAPVGTFEDGKSPYGIYDLAGNVTEWVADWYSETYYQSSPSSNPLGPDMGQSRVIRGGDWSVIEDFLRISHRFEFDLSSANRTIGFRCAREAQ